MDILLVALNKILSELKINATAVTANKNKSTIIYDVVLNGKTKIGTIERSAMEMGLMARSMSPPIITPMLHDGVVKIEFIMRPIDTVAFDESVIRNSPFKLPMFIGKSTQGDNIVTALETVPHLLVAGASGSGKSVMIQAIINSLMTVADKNNIKFSLIDPKIVEFGLYKQCKYLYNDISFSEKDIEACLENISDDMNNRFSVMAKKNARSISDINSNNFPYIVLVIDELADVSKHGSKNAKKLLLQIAQKGRAAGIHMVVGTQRPSVDVISGSIKANIPGRIACRVSSSVDSRVVLGTNGAEKLRTPGSAIIKINDIDLMQVRGPYINTKDIQARAASYKRSRFWLF